MEVEEFAVSPPPNSNPKRRKSLLGMPMRLGTPSKRESLDKENNLATVFNIPENLDDCEKTKNSSRRTSGLMSFSDRQSDHRMSICGARLSLEESHSTQTSVEKGRSPNSSWKIDDFTLGKPIGKGKFGNVYRGTQKCSKVDVAIKVLMKASITANDSVHLLRREVEIHSRLSHPNIIKMVGYFHDSKSAYLMLEFAPGGELYKIISQSGGYVETAQAIDLTLQIGSAVSYLHQHFICHRDIKPENMLVGADGRLRLSDFGWAVHIPIHGSDCPARRFTMCGTAEYVSPELASGLGHGLEVDNWALGIFFYELLYGKTPFSNEVQDAMATKEDIEQGIYSRILSVTCIANDSLPNIPFHYSKRIKNHQHVTLKLQNLIRALLHPQLKMRMTAESLCTLLGKSNN